jgi:hypothetical protein
MKKLIKQGDWFIRVDNGLLEAGFEDDFLEEKLVFILFGIEVIPNDELLGATLTMIRAGADHEVLEELITPFLKRPEPAPHLGEFDPTAAWRVVVA